MAIFDEIKSAVNSGTAAVGRGTQSIQLKSQLSSLDKKREQLMAQLGASLYEETRANPALRDPREQVYVSIEQLDEQHAQVQMEIESLEQQSQAAAAARTYFPCPQCGKNVSIKDTFCTGCGMNVQQYLQQQQQQPAPLLLDPNAPRCAQCGAALEQGAKFCTGCGTPTVA